MMVCCLAGISVGVHSAFAVDCGEIKSAETKLGNIAAAGQTDSYWLNAQQDQRIVVEAGVITGYLSLKIQLLRPDFTLAASFSGAPNARLSFSLDQSGRWTIIVSDVQGYRIGAYGLSCLLIPGPTTSTDDLDGGDIVSSEPFFGEISPGGDTDAWNFYGQQGQEVTVEMDKLTNLEPYIRLYRPDGTLATSSHGVSYAYIGKYILDQSGIWTIVAADYYGSKTGKYQLVAMLPTGNSGIYNPSPQNKSTIIDLTGSFSWDAVDGATGYDIYFGTDEPLGKIADNISSPSFSFPECERWRVYYWRVVAHLPAGDIEGPYWWFLTSPVYEIKQKKSNGIEIPNGGISYDTNVIFEGRVYDPDGDAVKIEVDIVPLSGDFDGEPEGGSDYVESGNIASVEIQGLAKGTYKWRVRAIDEEGNKTPWIETGLTFILTNSGDVNGDGETDISDVILCLRMAINLDQPDASVADMNSDGVVDISDVILILRKAIGLD